MCIAGIIHQNPCSLQLKYNYVRFIASQIGQKIVLAYQDVLPSSNVASGHACQRASVSPSPRHLLLNARFYPGHPSQ